MLMASYILKDGDLILASGSRTRQKLLEDMHIAFTAIPAQIDEEAIKQAASADNIDPAGIAEMLADLKAQQIALSKDEYILGCDQILVCDGQIYSKAQTPQIAEQHLRQLSGSTHQLISAAVMYFGKQRIWHHVAISELTMRQLSDDDIASYCALNRDALTSSVGCYQLENGGAHLFSRISGDFFDILGLPLLPLLGFFRQRGLEYKGQHR